MKTPMSKECVDYGKLRNLLQGLKQTTTELSSPGEGETFIEHGAPGWCLDDYMGRFAKWAGMPTYDGRNQRRPCSMDALYIDDNGTLVLVEFKKDRIFEPKSNPHNPQFRRIPGSPEIRDDYRLWLCRKLSDTFISLALRGVFPQFKDGKWRKSVKAYIVICAEKNRWGSTNPVARGIRERNVNYSLPLGLPDYLFGTVRIIDETRFLMDVVPTFAADFPTAKKACANRPTAS